MALDDPELMAEFVTEAREHLAGIEGQLLEIEAGGAKINVELVNTVFRAIHSIKGAAGFMGLSTVNKLAHSLENVLGKMRNRELVPTSPIVDTLLRAADALTKLINNLETSNEADVSAHITALEAIVAGSAPAPPAEVPAAPKPSGPDVAVQAPFAAPAVAPAAAHSEPAQPRVAPVVVEAAKNCNSIPAELARASTPVTAVPPTPAENSIRVSVGVLDSLMNLAGELVLGRNQLIQTLSTHSHSGIETVAARLDQVTSELQEAIMQTRMQPIGNVFSKFPRLVRDLSNKLGKQCEIVVDGKDVEIDKTIIEAIGDPLTHLVRNSVDHGIESPAQRVAHGKNAVGTIKLRAYHQAGKVRIDVSDDGAGIDPARLKQKAVDKGAITAEQSSRMSDRDAVRLIFHPGFSTAEKVTDVSGRGVGMDVVRTNIEKLGGTVDIESTPGRGTTIQITLPLTLAIIPSLIIRARGERFAMPQVNVLELVRVHADEAHEHLGRVKDAEVLRLRGALLPLIRLGEVLRLSAVGTGPAAQADNIIVVETGQHRYALVVDEIVDSEEIVVKPLGRHVKSCTCLAGATILGDGHVALILDAAGVAAVAKLSAIQEEQSLAATPAGSDLRFGHDVQDLLLFSLAPGDHFAVPMNLVSRIERVPASKIEFVGQQRLLQYHGSALPLVRLEDFLTARPTEETSHVFVIVVRAAGRELGIVAPWLEDIRQIAADIDAETFREQGVAGAFVYHDATIRLVDVVELAEAAHPAWFAATEIAPQQSHETSPPLVLVVEDSAFFRNQLATFLTAKGYQVVTRDDGARAWDYLTNESHQVRLVITDIEMPNLDGFALCRKIKQHPALGEIPVVALTSLASEADVERGREAGIDDYQIKMDRERLQETMVRLLDRSQRCLAATEFNAERGSPAVCVTA